MGHRYFFELKYIKCFFFNKSFFVYSCCVSLKRGKQTSFEEREEIVKGHLFMKSVHEISKKPGKRRVSYDQQN